RLRPAIFAPAGPRPRRVDAAAVRTGRTGGRAGLACLAGDGDRRGPGAVGRGCGRAAWVRTPGRGDHDGACGAGAGPGDVAAGPRGPGLASADRVVLAGRGTAGRCRRGL